jgi:5-hydroxyisourate hydrolase-like protein (transthyretin family)
MTPRSHAVRRLVTTLVLSLGLATLAAPATAATATGTITGTLTGTDGRAIAGVRVTSRIPGDVPQPTATATTRADGRYSLTVPAGTDVQVCASATDRLPVCFDAQRGFVIDRTAPSTPWAGRGTHVSVAPGAQRAGTSFQVPQPARFRGLLTDASGRPAAGVTVTAHTDDVRGNDDSATTVSNGAGRYELVLPGQLDSPAAYCLDVAAPAGDGYTRVRRFQTRQGDGVWFGCTRSVTAGDALTEDVTLTADGGTVKNVATPYFVGTPKVGYTLSARPGKWDPAGATLTYAWFDGARLLGTGATYVVRPAELGHTISVTATATAPGRAAATKSWASPHTVVRGTFWIRSSPKIDGRAKVGRRLKARSSATEPDGRRTYRWLRDGKAIRGATGSTYRVKKADRRHRLTVRVVYTAPAYETATRTSRSTRRVR